MRGEFCLENHLPALEILDLDTSRKYMGMLSGRELVLCKPQSGMCEEAGKVLLGDMLFSQESYVTGVSIVAVWLSFIQCTGEKLVEICLSG